MGSIRLPAGSFRVCLGSFSQPWSFGPYARQLTVLAGQLAKNHVVMWLALGYHDTEVRIKVPGLPENVGMLGGNFPRNQGVYVSSINALLDKHKMDVFISLMDLNRVFVDEMFSPLAISWFPNHFVSLDLHSRHALTAYDAVAVLGPSDATRVQEQLPHKHVMHIPHVIEDPGGLGETPRSVLRQKYGVPAGKFLALVNFANYDAEKNRKSIDLSLLAWKAFYEAYGDKALLYLHAVRLPTEGVHLPGLLHMSEVPPASYILDERELKYEEALELARMADVLLQPSKTEGFGMPVLEAQLLGTPAITTRFGAMADFTLYGVSVPPVQPHSMGLGYAVMPNLTGIVEALHHVAPPSALDKADGKRAAQMVRANMSQAAVAASFEQLIALPKPKPAIGVVRYGQPPVLRGEWTVVASETQAVDLTAIAFDTARADGETPPREAILFRTTELSGEFTPSAFELERGNITPQPVFAARTTALRAALEQTGGGGKFGELDMAVRSLIQQHHLLADVGGGGPGARAGELLGGIGAARIYLPPVMPNGGGPVGGPQGRPQGGDPQQMQALTQEHHETLMMLAEAQERAAKVSVAADGTVGRASA